MRNRAEKHAIVGVSAINVMLGMLAWAFSSLCAGCKFTGGGPMKAERSPGSPIDPIDALAILFSTHNRPDGYHLSNTGEH